MHMRAALLTAALLLILPNHASAAMTLKRVFLSQGGVAYYEFAATVSGPANLTLDIPRDHVDDAMKSLVVFDDSGAVGSVTLAGSAPLGEAFRGLPFTPEALSSLTALFDALKGELVTVEGARPVTGRIMSVDRTMTGNGEVRERLSLLTPAGIEQVHLDEARRVAFADEALNAAFVAALDAMAKARDADTRTLNISQAGRGNRVVRVGYVAAAPLWKTSYRISVTGRAGRLQGWAILENFSGHDWDGIELTLASGNPVTFRHALYEAYFVDRPEVPVELYDRLLPDVDTGVMAAQESVAYDALEKSSRSGQMLGAAPAPVSPAARIADTPTQIVFRVEKGVTLAAGQSLMLPLVDQVVPAMRVTHVTGAEEQPFAAIGLRNMTGTALPPGVMTLYETGPDGNVYLGDARMGLLPVGEDRLLAFAADAKFRIGQRTATARDIAEGRIVDGVLTLTHVTRHRRAFDLTTPEGEPRRVMVDVTAPAHWRLVVPASGAERIAEGYRLTADLGGGESRTIEAVFEETRAETVEILNLNEDRLLAYARGGGLDESVRRGLEAAAKGRRMVSETERRLESVDVRYKDTVAEQERLRESVKSVPETSEIYTRYMDSLTRTEDRLDTLAEEREAARSALEAARTQFTEFVRNLKIGR